ncbi:zinc finger protein, partial [Clarias magur]
FKPFKMKSESRQQCLRESPQTSAAAWSQFGENVQTSNSTILSEDFVDQQTKGMHVQHLKEERPVKHSLYALADYCGSFFNNKYKMVSSRGITFPAPVTVEATNQANLGVFTKAEGSPADPSNLISQPCQRDSTDSQKKAMTSPLCRK